jgi:hypothetical protein
MSCLPYQIKDIQLKKKNNNNNTLPLYRKLQLFPIGNYKITSGETLSRAQTLHSLKEQNICLWNDGNFSVLSEKHKTHGTVI